MDRRVCHSRNQLWPQSPLGFWWEVSRIAVAPGLMHAFSPSLGAVSGRIVTMGNVSAEEGGSVILQCHLSSTTAKVTQVNWEQQDQLLAVHHANLGWHIYPAFRERMAPGPNLGLTLQSLTRNDTGEYFCTYHTYPDGIYRGTLFLEVLHSSGMPSAAGWLMNFILQNRKCVPAEHSARAGSLNLGSHSNHQGALMILMLVPLCRPA